MELNKILEEISTEPFVFNLNHEMHYDYFLENGIHIIQSGSIIESHINPDGDILYSNISSEGEWVGFNSFFGLEELGKYRCREPVLGVKITPSINPQLKNDPNFLIEYSKKLLYNNKKKDRQLYLTNCKDIKKSIITTISLYPDLKKKLLTRDISELIGITRETICRYMKEIKLEIKTNPRKYINKHNKKVVLRYFNK